MTKHLLDSVQKFHETFGHPVSDVPHLPHPGLRDLRIDLLQEEFNEYLEGEETSNLVEIADALGDMLYIIAGTCLVYGLPMAEIFDEIQASNMSKLGENGEVIRREDGKILKGPNYFKPNIKKIIDEKLKAVEMIDDDMPVSAYSQEIEELNEVERAITFLQSKFTDPDFTHILETMKQEHVKGNQ